MSQPIETIIFDLGGVLIDWNPFYLYRKIFNTDEEIQDFLDHICTFHWNEQQDAGRPLQEATEILIAQHPQHESNIRAYYGRWEEMLGGPIHDTVSILKSIHQQGKHALYALTNWSHETFPIAQERYDFLQLFEGILVSGEEKMKKPDSRIYQLIIDRYKIEPSTALFIDDNLRNVEAARDIGIQAIHFQSPQLLSDLLIKKNAL